MPVCRLPAVGGCSSACVRGVWPLSCQGPACGAGPCRIGGTATAATSAGRLRGGGPPAAAAAPPPPYVAAFTAACADVAADARKARSNLAQLETLVRGASIFSDPAEKIAHLVHAASDRLGRAAAALVERWKRVARRDGVAD